MGWAGAQPTCPAMGRHRPSLLPAQGGRWSHQVSSQQKAPPSAILTQISGKAPQTPGPAHAPQRSWGVAGPPCQSSGSALQGAQPVSSTLHKGPASYNCRVVHRACSQMRSPATCQHIGLCHGTSSKQDMGPWQKPTCIMMAGSGVLPFMMCADLHGSSPLLDVCASASRQSRLEPCYREFGALCVYLSR